MQPKERLQILVVDDDASQRMLIANLIRNPAFDISFASDGQHALSVIEKVSPCIIICDCHMPKMDGWLLCQYIRNHDSQHYVYVILVTSDSENGSFEKGIASGADDFIRKPVMSELLAYKVDVAARVIDKIQNLIQKNKILQQSYKEQCKSLKSAGDLQRGLMPSDKNYDKFSIISRNIPAAEISGDIQNHFLLPDKNILFFQADAVGHGLPAALLSVSLMRILNSRFCAPNNTTLTPGTIVSRLNTRMQSEADPIEYFTMLLGIICPKTMEVRFCQAGHPKPLIQRNPGMIESVGSGGLPVGLFKDAKYTTEYIKLSPGDRLWIMTDGVAECYNKESIIFGDDNLERILNRTNEISAENQIETVIDAINTWNDGSSQIDDISIMSIIC